MSGTIKFLNKYDWHGPSGVYNAVLEHFVNTVDMDKSMKDQVRASIDSHGYCPFDEISTTQLKEFRHELGNFREVYLKKVAGYNPSAVEITSVLLDELRRVIDTAIANAKY